MRKLFINKWFFLAVFFTFSLSVFSLIAYQTKGSTLPATMNGCEEKTAGSIEKTDLIWNLLSKPLTYFISIR
jgi:hypothetical protein